MPAALALVNIMEVVYFLISLTNLEIEKTWRGVLICGDEEKQRSARNEKKGGNITWRFWETLLANYYMIVV